MALLNITWAGQNGDLKDEVEFDASDAQVLAWAQEAVVGGDVNGIDAAAPDFTDFVVQRFSATGDLPARIFVRPKTPFGA